MNEQQGRLIGIAIRGQSRAPMVEVDVAEITAAAGVTGDFRGRSSGRQVTVLSTEDWQAACAELGRELPWTTRRANLLVEGLSLRGTTGAVLRIGDVLLQVTGETDPCSRMEEAAEGLCSALTPDWRGGACCRVIQGGTVRPNATVNLESSEAQ